MVRTISPLAGDRRSWTYLLLVWFEPSGTKPSEGAPRTVADRNRRSTDRASGDFTRRKGERRKRCTHLGVRYHIRLVLTPRNNDSLQDLRSKVETGRCMKNEIAGYACGRSGSELLTGSLTDASLFEVLVRAALPFFALPAILLVVLLVFDRLCCWGDELRPPPQGEPLNQRARPSTGLSSHPRRQSLGPARVGGPGVAARSKTPGHI
jgi:hypothetical protein